MRFITVLGLLVWLMGCGRESGIPDASSVASFDDANGAVALYHFNESAGSTTFLDSSQSGNNATCSGTCPVAGEQGKFAQSASFDGTSQFLQVTNNTNLDNVANLTIAFWMYPTALDGGTARAVVSKRIGTSSGQSYSVFFYTGDKMAVDLDTNNDRFSTTYTFTNNRWYHFAVTFDGSQASGSRVNTYVNGVFDRVATEASSVIPAYASNLTIGTLHNGDGRYYGGLLDEVGIYNKTMTALDVRQMYFRTGGSRVDLFHLVDKMTDARTWFWIR